jgi:hypothetical protein
LQLLRDAALDRSVIVGEKNTNSPHQTYKYPARYSPRFVSAAIELITEPGDLILDPFVGSGTTTIEALRHGRNSLGIDVSPISTFLARAQISNCRSRDLSLFYSWFRRRLYRYAENVNRLALPPSMPLKNLDLQRSWRHLRLVGALLDFSREVTTLQERVSRQVVLKSSQWAFDVKSEIPTFGEFVEHLNNDAVHVVDVCHAFSDQLTDEWGRGWRHFTSIVHKGDSAGVLRRKLLEGAEKADAVITSPPYPGVHVLYGRWQVYGRRETDLPHWILGTHPNLSEGSYTMHARREPDNATYFKSLGEVMSATRKLVRRDALMIQMVGFSKPRAQLETYLKSVSAAGFRELKSKRLATSSDGRLWRSVPSRRWYANANVRRTGTSNEVVLMFRAT